ncbi:MAG: CBS domain-containing protein [Desulfamplus sp.]|nr:CBS domain-containing protein [Desulfamplus sp.]
MRDIQVRELMVSISAYATVDENATMFEAVNALEQAREKFDPKKLRHRAILVTDSNKRVVGKIGYLDFLQSLEPKYSEIEELLQTINKDLGSKYHLAGEFTPEMLHSQIQKYSLWQKPLNDLCGKAANFHAKDIMYAPKEADYIDIDATLDQAIHQFVLLKVQSLLVKDGDNDVVGILRLSDVVESIFGLLKTCKI